MNILLNVPFHLPRVASYLKTKYFDNVLGDPVSLQLGRFTKAEQYLRGLPSGYVALVEQRLLESELVVFELLSTLYNDNGARMPSNLSHQDRDILSDFAKAQSKLKKVDEWKNYPLATDEERHAWWLRKREVIDLSRREGSMREHRHARSDVLHNASPASTCTTPNAPSEAQLPPVESPLEAVAELIGWEHEMGDASNIDFNALAQDGNSSNTLQGAPLVTVGNPAEQASPSVRGSNADRWRKYF